MACAAEVKPSAAAALKYLAFFNIDPLGVSVRLAYRYDIAKEKGWRAWSPALAENSFGCFLPDLTRFTTVQCGGARHCSLPQLKTGRPAAIMPVDTRDCEPARRAPTGRNRAQAGKSGVIQFFARIDTNNSAGRQQRAAQLPQPRPAATG